MIDLQPEHLEIIKQILRQHFPAADIRVFGSRVNGTARPFSDIDLAIITNQKITFDSMRLAREAFENSTLPIRVDLVDWQSIPESFQSIINQNFISLPL